MSKANGIFRLTEVESHIIRDLTRGLNQTQNKGAVLEGLLYDFQRIGIPLASTTHSDIHQGGELSKQFSRLQSGLPVTLTLETGRPGLTRGFLNIQLAHLSEQQLSASEAHFYSVYTTRPYEAVRRFVTPNNVDGLQRHVAVTMRALGSDPFELSKISEQLPFMTAYQHSPEEHQNVILIPHALTIAAPQQQAQELEVAVNSI
jgi:hypothetical protein